MSSKFGDCHTIQELCFWASCTVPSPSEWPPFFTVHLMNNLIFSQGFSWHISVIPQLHWQFMYWLKDNWTLVWTTEPCITNKTHKNSHRIFHSQSACQMLFSFPSWMSVLHFSNRNGKSISQHVFLIDQKLPWNIIVLLYIFFEHTTPIYIYRHVALYE